MRHGYIAAGVVVVIAACWVGWNSLTPTPKTTAPVVAVSEGPKPPRTFASRPKPPEVIDLSRIFEPVADEDRAPSLSELELVGFFPAPAQPRGPNWLTELFKTAPASLTPEVFEFKGAPDFPGVPSTPPTKGDKSSQK
jgi:hypothetical protein